MASIGDGINSPAIEQDPSIAQIQSLQLGANAAILVGLPEVGFVASINSLSGLVTIAAGTNIAVTSDGVSTVTISVTGLTAPASAKSNIAAGAPSPSNDVSEGYSTFSLWLDTLLNNFYMCASNTTGAAVWVLLG